MTLNSVSPALESELRAALPEACFRDLAPRYLEEPRGLLKGRSGLLMAPATAEEVSVIVKACLRHRVAVIPYGGGTGLVGGQIWMGATTPVILSLERMNRIREVNPGDNVIIAEAGVVLANIQDAAAEADRLFPLSLASEGTCQIGGNLSTNAGGVGVLRYGNTRDLCLGLEAVLPDGSIWHGLRRLRKDNTGFDLKQLLIGGEGTLGVITAASLKLFPKPERYATALMQILNPDAGLELLDLARRRLGAHVSAFELIHRQGLDFLAEKLPHVRLPFATPSEWMVLLDLGIIADAGVEARLEAMMEEALEKGLIVDALIAQNAQQRQDFWAVRETIPEANRLVGAIYSHDIAVPVSQIPAFIQRADKLIAEFGELRINCFGHVGDGNLHYNVYPPKGHSKEEFRHLREPIKTAVYALVDEFGGTVSAEHGIGRLKLSEFERFTPAPKLASMRAIKTALDPLGIMNPGAVIV